MCSYFKSVVNKSTNILYKCKLLYIQKNIAGTYNRYKISKAFLLFLSSRSK